MGRLARGGVCLLLAGALHAPAALALDPERSLDQYVHRAWTIEDGLPQNSGSALLQDGDGYLWIATYGGLARFDGDRFETVAQADHPDLPSDRLRALTEDPDGSLWIGSEGDGLTRLRDGRIETLQPPGGPTLGSVAALHVGASGELWIGADRGLFQRGKGGWRRFPRRGGGLSEGVLAVTETRDGSVWAGTLTGLGRVRSGVLEEAFPRVFGGRTIRALHQDRAGTLWIGGDHGRLWRLRDGRPEEVEAGLDGRGVIRDVLEDRHGNLWLAVDPQGLRRLRPGALGVWDPPVEVAIREVGRPGRPVIQAVSLAEDREGNLWIGTAGRGLHQLTVGAAMAYGGPGHPLGGGVVPIASDRAGGFYAGLACNGVVHRDAAGRMRRYGGEQGLENLCVWSLHLDAGGNLWIGTLGGGLYRLPAGSERVSRLSALATAGGAVQALFESPRWGLLVGTDQGVFRPADDGRRFERLTGTAPFQVQHLAESPGGVLWIGTHRGPYAVAAPGSEPRPPPAALAGPLATAMVRAIHFDDAGATWFGTYGHGMFRLHGGRLSQLKTDQGLAENVVSWIAEDGRGRFWTTGNRGVQRLSRSELEAVTEGRQERLWPILFTAADGMRSSECNGGGQPAGLLQEDGVLWVPTIDGVARFDTRRRRPHAPPPPVRIELVSVGGRPLPDIAPPAGHRSHAGDGQERVLELGSGVRNLEIRYTALSFLDPGRLRFRYRLEDLDDSWQDAGTRRVAYYPFVPPGRHRFRVVAGSEDHAWSRGGAAFTFIVEPRFTQTWPFRLLAFALALATVSALVGLRLGSVRRRERRLQEVVRARTTELEETRLHLERANRRLSRLATLDPLTGIANRRRLMERLDAEWRRAQRRERALGLLMIDIDQFKPYNDLHGHPAGDRCLSEVVDCLRLQLRRAGDLLARYGGEELAVVLPEISSLDTLQRVAETLRARVEDAGIPHGASPVSPWVTVSIGGALVVPHAEDSVEGLLAVADTALYAAKQAGRNRVVVVHMGDPTRNAPLVQTPA